MVSRIARFVDTLEKLWRCGPARRVRSVALVVVLLGGVALIEAGRWFDLGEGWSWLPTVHLVAISWSIGLLLLFEIVEIAFAMAKSVARSVARHLQLYALLLLRDAFLKLGSLGEPIKITLAELDRVAIMASDAGGAILVFIAAGFFSQLQRHTPITTDEEGGQRFRSIKKLIVLALLATLAWLCAARLFGSFASGPDIQLVETFFTVLVFVDVLLAFVSLGFTDNPAIVFRNFGFAFAAILLRLSVASPEFIRPTIGVLGALAAICVTVAYNIASKQGTATSAATTPEPSQAQPAKGPP